MDVEEPHKIEDQTKTREIAVATWAQRFHQTLCSSLANKIALTKSPDGRLHPNVSRRARSLSPLPHNDGDNDNFRHNNLHIYHRTYSPPACNC